MIDLEDVGKVLAELGKREFANRVVAMMEDKEVSDYISHFVSAETIKVIKLIGFEDEKEYNQVVEISAKAYLLAVEKITHAPNIITESKTTIEDLIASVKEEIAKLVETTSKKNLEKVLDVVHGVCIYTMKAVLNSLARLEKENNNDKPIL